MKLTEKQLKAIILEQLEIAHAQGRLDEGLFDTVVDRFKSWLPRKAGTASPTRGGQPSMAQPQAQPQTSVAPKAALPPPAAPQQQAAAPVVKSPPREQSSFARNRALLVDKFISSVTEIVKQRADIMRKGQDDVMKISRLARQLDAVRQQAINIVQDLTGIKMATIEMAKGELMKRGTQMPQDASSAKSFIDRYVSTLTSVAKNLSKIQQLTSKGSAITPAELKTWSDEVKKMVDVLTQMEGRLDFLDLMTFLKTLPESVSRKAAVISEVLRKNSTRSIVSEEKIRQIIREEITSFLTEQEEEEKEVSVAGFIDKIKDEAIKSLDDLKAAAVEFLKQGGEAAGKAIVDGIDDVIKAFTDAGGEADEEEVKEALNDANAEAS